MDKVGRRGMVLGLESVRELLRRLGTLQNLVPVIHVAGTNGKGSLCAYLREILSESGYRAGVYTSPAVFDERERYAVGERWISPGEYDRWMAVIQKTCDEMEREGWALPTRFEVETALAFCYFVQSGCDVAVIETGMGGETDATNVVEHPLCSVLTSIGADHIPVLGDSVEEVAKVKSGIIKRGCPAISAWQSSDVAAVLAAKAREAGARMVFVKEREVRRISTLPLRFHYKQWEHVTLSMAGEWQIANAALALEVVAALREQGMGLCDEAVYRGLERAHAPGRMECISKEPLCCIDGAHNLPAARQLAKTLKNEFTNMTFTYIIGVLADKDYEGMLRELGPMAENVIAVTPVNPRALPGEKLAKAAAAYCRRVVSCTSFYEAAARALAAGTDMVLAFGSLSYLRDIRAALKKRIEELQSV